MVRTGIGWIIDQASNVGGQPFLDKSMRCAHWGEVDEG